MAREKKPLPSPLDNVLKTGTIGGNTKPAKEPVTDEPSQEVAHTDVQKAIHTDTQQDAYTAILKDAHTDREDKVKQTIKIKPSLIRRVKIYVATHDKENISTVIEKALEQYLNKME